ncbi:non-hydrolyzing UDP-N-acetylglucosamine 2-epimerase [Teredinibacter sp. KSP-S5-2]|uniref:non-hydrolyzing UDP-N-acetylglucosamine 2-epimerase n=1 Tax=Teredinibacter sp. KSP-S5-2 TaxID=3034506 RepID=UPI0029347F7F|nr:UDP-N-acetylglucosamine 2-epimerase (non-hydrolyzing) [Teredinibacter sp. KSP-S5-2]WNO11725.1 UDP-N-acetylglucosamine 2-epimerase (non-hydrolyzing) [Teredinibacter sp. KSP-S5-2]
MRRINKILIVFGTRPEAIKMAPVVKQLVRVENVDVRICVTAQHREMLDQVLNLFDIVPHYDLDLMTSKQTLNQIVSKVLCGIEEVIAEFNPDLMLVHGDTTTTFSASLAAYHSKVDVGHVEAGLRTGDIYSPWPEEINRKLTSSIAKYHFAPTDFAKENLIREGVAESSICVTGNTVIDALFYTLDYCADDKRFEDTLHEKYKIDFSKKLILVTGHRRENFGEGFQNICKAIGDIAIRNPDVQLVYPVHLNPNVQEPVKRVLEGLQNVLLIPPLDYRKFVFLMSKAYLILTDSGGIQEEAPSLNKPVLVMRDTTERPEAVESGAVKIVGNQTKSIVSGVEMLIQNAEKYREMSSAVNPYGSGDASQKIVDYLFG